MKHWPWSVALAAALGSVAPAAHADTYTVTTTADSGAGSFRQALLDANAHAGMDTIAFNIAGAGVQSIKPQSSLPHITDPLTLDGYTQPGSSPNSNNRYDGINAHLLVEIDLSEVSEGVANLTLDAGAAGSTIRGIVLNHFNYAGIVVEADSVTIQGNYIGTNAEGSATFADQSRACIEQNDGGTNLTIGGLDESEYNLLSTRGGGVQLNMQFETKGGASPSGVLSPEVTIQDNYIGTDATGNRMLGDDGAPGIYGADHAAIYNNLIGGQDASEGVVANNQTLLSGNLIGTQRDGTSPMPNGHIVYGAYLQGQNNYVTHNIIAFSDCAALKMEDSFDITTITQNTMFSNNFGIDYGGNSCGVPQPNQPGGSRNYPQISANVAGNFATISGTINSTASTPITIEFFSNDTCNATGYGEGKTYLGSTDVTTDASGNASFGPLGFDFPEGEGVITATATNDAGETSEFSKCANPTAGTAPTTTTLASSLNPSTHGQTVTFTATVLTPMFKRAPTAGDKALGGNVQFYDGAATLSAPVTLGADGTATFATGQLAVGTHTITAAYSGDDANNAPSTSPPLAQVVNAAGGGTDPASSTPVPALSFWLALLLAALLGWVGYRRAGARR